MMFFVQGQKGRETWDGRLVRFLLVILLVLSFVASPALADDGELEEGEIVMDIKAIQIEISNGLTSVAKAVEENALYVEIASMWTTLKGTFSGLMDATKLLDTTNSKALLSGKQASSEVEKRTAQFIADSKAKDVLIGEQMRNKVETMPPLPSEQWLCNVLLARQAPMAMVRFARMVSSIVGRGVDAVYRGPWSNGAGPEYYADFEESHKSMRNVIDGYDPDTAAPVNTVNESDADMDSSIDALSRDKTYIMPPVKLVDRTVNGQSIKVMTFEVDADRIDDAAAQENWIKATRYCYTLAGPRPSPPPINTKDTEASRRKRAMYDSCRGRQAAFIKMCRDRIGSMTRPNCDLDEMKGFCDMAQDSCEAAAEAHIQLDPSFNNCRNGLSLYEFEKISNLMCGSGRRFQADGHTSVPQDQQIQVLSVCGHLASKWEEKIQNQDEAFMSAIEGMHSIQSCYAAIK